MRTKKVHKTCATWATTECGKLRWPWYEERPKTTERWDRVTCQHCLNRKLLK